MPYAVVKASTHISFGIVFKLIFVHPFLPHLLGTGNITVSSNTQNKSRSVSVNFVVAQLSLAFKVANIFLFTLNDAFFKCGSSVVTEKERAIFLNVDNDTIIYQLSFNKD